MTAYFVPQTQKGGCNIKKTRGCTIQTFLELFCFLYVATYYSDSIMPIQKNPGRR